MTERIYFLQSPWLDIEGPENKPEFSILSTGHSHESIFNSISLLVPVFSALRLAKFNNDFRQKDAFIGLPTPANALLIASLSIIPFQYPDSINILFNPYFFIGFVALSCYLLVSEIRLLLVQIHSFFFFRKPDCVYFSDFVVIFDSITAIAGCASHYFVLYRFICAQNPVPLEITRNPENP